MTMDDPYAVVRHWEAAFNAGDADAVTALYAPSATLW
jgi:ketosteroid isomerase-like protein